MGAGLPSKVEGLEVSEAANGFVVFDSRRDRVHYLNHTAVLILELCTGEMSAVDIADFLQEAYSLAEAPVTDVEAYITRLAEEGLVA